MQKCCTKKLHILTDVEFLKLVLVAYILFSSSWMYFMLEK